jgi:hypothetical protein
MILILGYPDYSEELSLTGLCNRRVLINDMGLCASWPENAVRIYVWAMLQLINCSWLKLVEMVCPAESEST